MQTDTTLEKTTKRDHRLDVIKAISIILVLCWHLQPLDITAPKLTDFHISGIFREGIKTFYSQVTLLGVPSFILVSLYLYFQNLNDRGYSYTRTRLVHLLKLFAFWVTCQIVIYALTSYPSSTPLAERVVSTFNSLSLYNVFIEGGPRLDFIGGGSVFYYFTTLFLLTIFATIYFALTKIPWVQISIGAFGIIASLIFFEYCSLNNIYIELLDIRTFMIYIPLTHFLWLTKSNFSKWLWVISLAGYILFSIQDYYLRRQGFVTNVYLRDSVVFGATTIFYGIKNLPLHRESKILTFFSVYSLGIYATHKYFQYLSLTLLTPLFELYNIGKKTHFGEIHVNMQVLSIAILATSLTLICVYLLGKTPLKRFVK